MVLKKIVPMVNSNDSKIFSDSSIEIFNDLMVGYKYPMGNSKEIEFSDALKHSSSTIRLDAVNQLLAKPNDSKLRERFAHIIANDSSFNSLKIDLKTRLQNLNNGIHARTSFSNEPLADFLKEYQENFI